MTTEAQVASNRRNAARSTGPRTPEGKAAVAQNAIKHGLLSRRAVIKDEDPAEFEFYRGQMIESLMPQDAAELMLVQRIVELSWRLKRAERMQDEAFDFLLEADAREYQTRRLRDENDPAGAVELTFGRVVAREFAGGKMLEKLMTYERWIENSLYKTMNELHRLRREQQAVKQSQSEEVGWAGSPPMPFDQHGQPVAHPTSAEASTARQDDVSCETKPAEAVEPICSAPARAEESSQLSVVGCQQGTHGPTENREPTTANYTETPDGVTTSEVDGAKQSQSPATGEAAGACAKQSQRPGPRIGGYLTVPRQARVAWHYKTGRS